MKYMGEASYVLSLMNFDMCPKTPNEKVQMSKVPYSSVVDSLMYIMICTRPGICCTVEFVSIFQSNPSSKHLMAVKRILRYLKRTLDYVLCYQGKDLHLAGYIDAD